MNKQVFADPALGEEYTVATHASGLKIYICEKKEFTGCYAVFGTKYGSVDNAFKTEGEDTFTEVPEGIAHFLEHKLFESEDGDAFVRYAKTGASANAYTSFDRTCYLFNCTDRFDESFAILLDFVQHPYFTQQTVEKEQGIIGQEISMYDDTPDWVVLFRALEGMYHTNPVRINIAGTAKTIAQIDADLLYRCYRTFYNLNNMFLVVVGNVDTDHVLAMCEEQLQPSEPVTVVTRPVNEPRDVVCHFTTCKMAVSMPQFIYGLKLDAEGYLPLRERAEIDLLLRILTGSQSAFYNQLLNEGLINRSFGGSLFAGRNFACILFSGESKDPEAVRDRIRDEIIRLQAEGIDPRDFEPMRRMIYGQQINCFNSVDDIGDALTDCACDGTTLFENVDVYRSMTVEDLNLRLRCAFDLERDTLSVITPMETEE